MCAHCGYLWIYSPHFSASYLLLSAAAQVTSETRFLDLNDPTGTLRMLFPRRNKVNYVVEHHNFVDANAGSQNARGYFYVMTNENAKNNQLFRVPVPSKDELDSRYRAGMLPEHAAAVKESVVDNRDFVLIEAFQLRARHLIVFERSNCSRKEPGVYLCVCV